MDTVALTHAAEADFNAILAFIAAGSPAMADHVGFRLSSTIDSLEEFPERGRVALEETQSWGSTVRMLLAFKYRVLYTVRATDVVVLRIVHGSKIQPVPPGE